MREEIVKVDGLALDVTRTITSVELQNPHSTTRTVDGLDWGGRVRIMVGDAYLGNREIDLAIRRTSSITNDELNTIAQVKYSMDYDELTVAEARPLPGEVLAGKMISAINDADAGITVGDVDTLVTAIVSALA